MNSIKPIVLSAFSALVLVGCGAQKQIPSINSVSNAIHIPLNTEKKSALTESELMRWSHLDMVNDTIPGMSVDRAYAELLKDKQGEKVIVGIIDSGVDIDHEDLKPVIWTNEKEIPDNGIDDDKNGYIDDVHGWNFLGDDVLENLEVTRILKKGDDGSETYKLALANYEEKYNKALEGKQQVDFLLSTNKSIQDYLKKDEYSLEDLQNMETTDEVLNRNKRIMTQVIGQAGPKFNAELEEYRKYIYDQLDYNLNKDFDGRKVLGDNPDDIKTTQYGNNVVYGPDKEEALHGTHVSGIVAQIRNNNLGGDGIANNVAIMAIRAVPNGDEYDKDIALAIRYAVDNGAKVINGSFGKSFSTHKQWVFDAIKYAEKKDVLIVHAAGNDGHDVDIEKNINFPNDTEDNKTEFAHNVLTIGALDNKYGEKVIASFSNFGKINVDIYAPGTEIYASVPNNKYKYEQGTSMASPNVAGVAALIRSYYPKLKASQVKQIIMDSGLPLPVTVEVGENQEKKSATDSSKTGKMVNAYNALLLAGKMFKN